MSTLDDLTTSAPRGMAGLVHRLSERFGTASRRGFLLSTAVAGSALATNPRAYALTPVTAYATICGPGNTASSGWTVFCCTINKGVNACPPGSFAAGWWKAWDSSWCGGGYRYIVDCNAQCTKCTSGCAGDHICDKGCWNCSCGSGSTATCDQRRVCCNAFRYGQCNTHVKCSGGVHCRVVSCVPPYQWANCTTTSLRDDRTKEHSAPCLQQWTEIAAKYKAMGEHGSYLKASKGPQRAVGDGRGHYVLYQGGVIYWTSATRSVAVNEWVRQQYAKVGGPLGPMGYPKADRLTGRRDGGWIQIFEKGAITDSSSTTTQAVYGRMYTAWVAAGRETGVLGYPRGPVAAVTRGQRQLFQGGELWALGSTGAARRVYGYVLTAWKAAGGADGRYGYPLTDTAPDHEGRLTCRFEGGVIRQPRRRVVVDVELG